MGRLRRRIRGTGALGNAADEYAKYYPPLHQPPAFLPAERLGRVIGKPLLFSLSNAWGKYYQVDTHRRPPAVADEFRTGPSPG